MKQLILMVGPPGSGKSTLALEHCSKEGLIYINQDTQGKEHLTLFNERIRLGHSIIVDRMSFNVQQRERYLKPAREAGYTTKIYVLHESYDTCLQRCLKREGHATIKNETDAKSALNTFFSKYERVQDSEADEVIRVWPAGAKDKAVWIDVDNTLSDASHREHYLQGPKKNWKGFFDAMGDDPINSWCQDLIYALCPRIKILICSARPDDYKKVTEDWLERNHILYDELIMRRRNDSRKDSIVKEIMFEFEVKTRYNLLFSVDDRKQVVDQIRSHGVVVLDCAGNTF